MLYRALIKTHHMTSRKKLAAIHALTRKHGCVVYLKKGLRPPAVMVAERYSWVAETEELGEKEMEDGGEQGEKGMEDGGDQGEKVLRAWVKGVKRLRYKQFQLLGLEPVESRGGLEGKRGDVREFDSLKELAAELQKCGVLEWWRSHMFGIYDSGSLRDKRVDLEDME